MERHLFKDSFTLHSNLSIDEIVIRLGLKIMPAPLISWRWPVPYDGEVTATGFRATRMINYQNSFLPRIKGHFESLSDGTAIHVTMAPHPLVVGLATLMGLFGYGATLPFYLSAKASILTFLFLGVPVVFSLIALLGFWTEVRRSRRDLIKFTNGQLQQPQRTDSLGFKVQTQS